MKKHHLIISGTGRAGTSLLVKFLSACGLESQLTEDKNNVYWNCDAKAGIENNILLDENLPYVLKAPWHDMSITQFFATRDIIIDAALLPVRDIVKVASSRVVLELRDRYERLPKLLNMPRVDAFGYTAGGCIYSLNPIDQAKEAALGFHQLILELVEHEIPIIFLEFPRFANDFEYLHKNISFLLPPEISKKDAENTFSSLIEQDALRMEKEMQNHLPHDDQCMPPAKGAVFPSLKELDNIALRRLAQKTADYKTQLASAETRLASAETRLASAETRLASAETRLAKIYFFRNWRITASLRKLSALLRRRP